MRGFCGAATVCTGLERGLWNDGRSFLELAHALLDGEMPERPECCLWGSAPFFEAHMADWYHKCCAQPRCAGVVVLKATSLYVCIGGLNVHTSSPQSFRLGVPCSKRFVEGNAVAICLNRSQQPRIRSKGFWHCFVPLSVCELGVPCSGAEESSFGMQSSKDGVESLSDQRQTQRRCQQPHHHQQTPAGVSEEGSGEDR